VVFGVLEVGSTRPKEFVAADTVFLQAVANVLAGAIARAEAADAAEQRIRELDMLLKEVHHRVKNSLQLVQNMLQMQARSVGEEARRELEQAANRIKTVGSVHHRLYAGPSVGHVEVAEFLRALLADLQLILPGGLSSAETKLEAPTILLPAATATVLGLVVTELVTNAAKYAVRPIFVQLEETDPGLLVTVEDSGSGFPTDFHAQSCSGLGMRLISTLADPAPGSIRIDRSVPFGRISVLLNR
jgi:two-component system, sensor histidine kinase PdtaS